MALGCDRMDLTEQIRRYEPFNRQEEQDQKLILSCLQTMEQVFTRENAVAHMTASAWVVNPSRDKVLLAYHRIYGSWAWLGGHADGERDLLKVALREASEESGVKELRAISEEIYSLEVLTVNGHFKRGSYVPSHLHLNITYLLEAAEGAPLPGKPDENDGAAWFPLDSVAEVSSESWLCENIYKKLQQKLTFI